MTRFQQLLAAVPLIGLAAAVALWAPTDLPPHVAGQRRTVTLTPCATDWLPWAVAWCAEGNVSCIDANDGPQGNPYCVDDLEVGQCASTRATPSQRDRVIAAGVSLTVPAGWVLCPYARVAKP